MTIAMWELCQQRRRYSTTSEEHYFNAQEEVKPARGKTTSAGSVRATGPDKKKARAGAIIHRAGENKLRS